MCRLHMTKMLHMIKKIWIIEKFEQKIDFGEKIYIWLNFWSNLKNSDFWWFWWHVSLWLTCISGYGYDMGELGLDYV